ncbi:MAG: hypothetical protein ACJ74G_04800 [Blastocatellia bacterium]
MEPTDKPHEGNGQRPIEVTPKKLLMIILKVVFKDRTTDEEIEKICSEYFKALDDLWGKP